MKLRAIRLRLLPLVLLFTLLLALPAHAHQESLASTKISFENKRMIFTFMIDQRSVLELGGYDITKVTSLDEEKLTSELKDKTYNYIINGLKITNNGQEMQPELEGISIPDFSNVQVDLVFTSTELIDNVNIHYDLFFETSDGKHKNVATIENGDTLSEFVFTNDNKDLSLEAGVEVPLWTALKQFTILGVEHIWFGYDHLMFLLALILLGGRFSDLIKIVTSFTIAHSITLILASLDIISLPGAFVESVIALSILYVAIENQFIQTIKYRWLLTFAFGLIHGFGFAGALAEIQIPKNHFIASLLTFNVGVEIGQLVIVAILLPIILYLKKFEWNRWVVRPISLAIALFGFNWFLVRAFGIEFLPFLDI
jgi:hydrogenase/urease accessory protein HupE